MVFVTPNYWVSKTVLMRKQSLRKYMMRINEVVTKTVKPKSPLTPAQARINSLRQGVERSRQQLKREQERQRQQREIERRRKQQQQQQSALL